MKTKEPEFKRLLSDYLNLIKRRDTPHPEFLYTLIKKIENAKSKGESSIISKKRK
jgi:hypothetical protein